MTEEEKEEKEKLLKGISADLRASRFTAKLCIRCGQKGHGQYDCPAPKPVISVTTLKRKRSESPEPKEESKTAKRPALTLATKEGRIWEVAESEDEMRE